MIVVALAWGCDDSGGTPGGSAGSGGHAGTSAGSGGTSGVGGAAGVSSGGGGQGAMAGGGAAGSGAGGAGAGAGAGGAAGASGTAGAGGMAGGGGEPPSAGGTAGVLAGAGGAGGASGGGSGGDGTGGGASGAGGDVSVSTLVPDPSWDCGMPEGLPPPASGELVFSATREIRDTYDVGATPYGERRIIGIDGGTATGPSLDATFLSGGFDFELTLSNGAVELEQIDVLRADDGTLIYLRSCGVAPAGATEVRIVPDFEVANSSDLAWLNTGTFVGTRVVDTQSNSVRLEVYDVSDVEPSAPTIELVDPAGDPHQPWECSTETGARGATVFTENVTLGSSLSVGASKRGTRNIIPITGGTLSGRVTGTVVPGGGDYQLIGGSTVLDARYALASDDGEYILVRNCGPFGALIPLFEARADGPYAFLNENTFLSSDPGAGNGGVTITFYERN
jgi:hypothetical protein